MEKNKNSKQCKMLFESILMAFLVALPLALVSVSYTQAQVVLSDQERLFIKEINDYRKNNGLKALKVSEALNEASEMMAKDMEENPSLINNDHKDSENRMPTDRANLFDYTYEVGENLAAGYKTASKVFEAWKNSEEHRNNMLNPDYKVLGVSRRVSGSDYKWYWVNMFGKEEKKSDTLKNDKEYKPLKTMRVSVTDGLGKPLPKAKIFVVNRGGTRISSGRASSMGRKTFKLEPREEYFIRASTPGYSIYTKKVKPGTKNELKVKVWLEKE